jgi:hypothetical protein
MTRRSVLLAPFVSAAKPALRPLDEQRQKAVAFDHPWGLYVRRLFGCPDQGEMNPETCNLTLGQIDYAEFRKARELAKKLFDFRD